MKLNHLIYLVLLCLFSGTAYAQPGNNAYQKRMVDSITLVYMTEAAVRTPILRQVVVSTDIIGAGTLRSKLDGERYFDSKVSQVRTTALVSLPLKSWGKNLISASFTMFHDQFKLGEVRPFDVRPVPPSNENISRLTIGLTASYRRLDSLFGHGVVYTANFSGLTGRANSIQKLSFLGGVIMTLKQTPSNSLAVGLMLNIDPSINFPFVPFVTYWHKFKNGIELNVNMPQQALLRKTLAPKLAATFGTSLGGSVSFFNYDKPTTHGDFNYTVLNLKTGFGVEYRVAKKILIGMSAGLQHSLSARAFGVNDKSNDYFLANKMAAVPYVNFSVSVLPLVNSIF